MAANRRITRESFHFWVYYSCMCMYVMSLSTARFLITLSVIILAANWLAQPNLRGRFAQFLSNKAAVAFSSIYVVHLVGLLWTQDLTFALTNDLLHKLPVLLMPMVFSSSPELSSTRIRRLLFLFIASILYASLVGLSIRLSNPYLDFREASPFVQHLSFSITLTIAALNLPLLVKQVSNNRSLLVASILISAWFIFFIFYLRALTAMVYLIGISTYTLFYFAYNYRNVIVKASLAVVVTVFVGFSAWLLVSMYQKAYYEVDTDLSSLPSYTDYGNRYRHDTTSVLRENGYLVNINISDSELEKAWSSRSSIDYKDADKLGHPIRFTLYRYMSSKGLNKDFQGFSKLDDKDIKAVEQGLTNYLYVQWPGIYVRIHQTMMGLYLYNETSHQYPTWSTLTERLDLWRASWEAFKVQPLFGWGTGSVLHAVDYGKEIIGSDRSGRTMRPHNQYLYFLLTIGAVGFIIVVGLYTYAVVATRAYRLYLFNAFILMYIIHFMANNSFESQVGNNTFVFFSLFYLFIYPKLIGNRRKA